ncbi:DUF7519 family protein [Halosimplex amylolyticum]|uniref:DUF7519 family protein n=1 Tax=Halosimplex amylolyticum TaxID=3396616 RepID=UPI003F552E28
MSNEPAGQAAEVDEPATTGAPVDDRELDTEEKETVRVDHSPPQVSRILATVATLIGVGATVPFNLLAAPFGISAVVLVAGGMYLRASRGYVSLGVGLGLVGTVISGAYGAVPLELMLLGVSALFVAWDAGQHGLSIGAQIGRDGRTERLELVHTGITTVAVVVVDVFAFSVFQLAGDGRPAPAVALIVLGVVVLLWVFRN